MGFRVRKSFKVMPGVRINVSPKSIGVSAGVTGARTSKSTSGRTTRSIGIPGTGISHVTTTTSGSGSRRKAAPRRPAAAPARPVAAVPKEPTPGFFAPKWEKALYRVLVATPDATALAGIGQMHEKARPVAALFETINSAMPAGDGQRGVELLSWLLDTGYDPARDAFLAKYLPGYLLRLPVAEGIVVHLPLDRTAMGLLLAELHQGTGNLQSAVVVVENLEPSTVTAVSLAELYAGLGRWEDVVSLTDGLADEDEASTYLLIQRGIALREQGFYDAAREAFKEALRLRSRPAGLRHRAFVERGLANLADGKKAAARKDFEKVLAEDSKYPDLKEHLAALV